MCSYRVIRLSEWGRDHFTFLSYRIHGKTLLGSAPRPSLHHETKYGLYWCKTLLKPIQRYFILFPSDYISLNCAQTPPIWSNKSETSIWFQFSFQIITLKMTCEKQKQWNVRGIISVVLLVVLFVGLRRIKLSNQWTAALVIPHNSVAQRRPAPALMLRGLQATYNTAWPLKCTDTC